MDAPIPQGGISMKLFIDQANAEFDEIVQKFPEPRHLAFPKYLTNFVFSLINPQLMQKYIEKRVVLESITKSENKKTLFFISPGDPKSLKNLCEAFKNIPNYTKVLLLIPRYTLVCQQILSLNGFIALQDSIPTNPSVEIAIFDFHADFLPVEDDFFLMPGYRTFLQQAVDHDYGEIYNSGRALAKLQTVFGRIPEVFTIGSNALRVKRVMDTMNETTNTLRTATPQIDTLIIIDRIADLYTPLMSQTTVEGLIDESFGINYGICVPPEGIIADQSLALTDRNETFRQTRMLNLEKAVDSIRGTVNELQSSIDALHSETSVKQKMEIIVRAKKMSDLKAKFESHLNVVSAAIDKIIQYYPSYNNIITKEYYLVKSGDTILDFAENLVTIWNDWATALRMICLQNIVGGTLSKKTVNYIQKEACMEFGLECQPMLIALEHLKFISSSPFSIKWAPICKELKIFPDDDDPVKEPLQGFVPPSIRIVQAAVNGNWSQVQRAYDDKVVPMTQTGQAPKHTDGEKRRILVFYVGGVTLSEVGILRNIGRLSQSVEFIVGATEKTNGYQLITDLFPPAAKI